MPLLNDTSSQEIVCGWIQEAVLINERKMVLSACRYSMWYSIPSLKKKNSPGFKVLDICHLSLTSLVSDQDKELT